MVISHDVVSKEKGRKITLLSVLRPLHINLIRGIHVPGGEKEF